MAMFDFTKRAKRVINEYAQQEAKRLGHDMIGAEHILLGLLREDDSVAIKILKNLNVEINELKREIERRSKQQGNTMVIEISAESDRYQKIIDYSKEEAKRLKHNYVGTEHILLALLRDNNNLAGSTLTSFNLNYSVIKGEILRILGVAMASINSGGARQGQSSTEKTRTPTLDEFTRDLTQMARDKKLLPVVGRSKEIQRLIQILCRKTKNNPVLIGEAGVGKTAIVEGIAERIVEHNVPDVLYDKRVIVLDLASLVAGTKYRGEFEDRLKRVMREIQNSKNIILFIDELHTLIGAGAAEGAIDAANMLKPALARGELQCIGATTINEYRRYIEKDAALERRFQAIQVQEPSIDDAILILQGIKDSFEKHHRVIFSDETLELAVRLSARHLTDRFLPDKAIDIIDEAGSWARLTYFTRPEDILKIEEEIKALTTKKDELVKAQEYEKAAQVRDEIGEQKNKLETEVLKWQEKIADHTVKISTDDIYNVISLWTGIPFSNIEEKEAERLLHMESKLAEKIVGQNEAIEQISKAVRRSRAGLGDKRKPAASFIFMGPTGVGKTELTNVLANFLFGTEKKLMRLDMSEFMEAHSVAKLIGSPPGYVGYDDAGRLCEFVRRNPHCIVLLDEIEKAHPDVFNILLQILDDASLTDTHGRRVDFTEAMIIMTSNIGAREMQKGSSLGFAEDTDRREVQKNEKVFEQLKKYFNPEFLNRLDEVITFKSLVATDVKKIIQIMLSKINDQAFESGKKIQIIVKDRALDYLALKGYDEKNGARPLRRLLQKEIEDKVAILLLEGGLKQPSSILFDVEEAEGSETKLQIAIEEWKDYEEVYKKKESDLAQKKSELDRQLFKTHLGPRVIKNQERHGLPLKSST